LEAHAPPQIDFRASTALRAPDNSILPALLHSCPQLATQCQEFTATHTSEPQAPRFAILLVPGAFQPHRAQRPNANHQALLWESSCCPVKKWELSNSRRLLRFCHSVGAKRPASLRHKKAQHLSLCLTAKEPLLLC
jgi:hypothetical protein